MGLLSVCRLGSLNCSDRLQLLSLMFTVKLTAKRFSGRCGPGAKVWVSVAGNLLALHDNSECQTSC